jgi:hypothetical protein
MKRSWFRLLYQSLDEFATRDDGLALDERIELLINRCFVRCTKDHWGLFPYDDRYAEPF